MPRKTKAKKKLPTPIPMFSQGRGLILAGILLLSIFGIWRIRELRLSFQGNLPKSVNRESQIIRIKIDKVKLDLAVEPAIINNGIWPVVEKNASHWANSANPGEKGNIVIYGHNRNNVFGPIRWLNLGDKIELTDKQGQIYEYKISETVTVKPDEIQYVEPTATETLTLYTCTGWWDSQRYIVIAKPIFPKFD